MIFWLHVLLFLYKHLREIVIEKGVTVFQILAEWHICSVLASNIKGLEFKSCTFKKNNLHPTPQG